MTEEQDQDGDCTVGPICLICEHEACGWCPDCHPEVPDL